MVVIAVALAAGANTATTILRAGHHPWQQPKRRRRAQPLATILVILIFSLG